MNDPHVKALYYRVVPGKNVDYDRAPPIEEDIGEFKISIDGSTAVFEMKTHCATADEARAVVDDYLRRWEVLIGLEHDPDDLRFAFKHADIIDRSPPATDKDVVNLHAHISAHVTVSGDVSVHLSRGKYPSRPNKFAVSPDVETMYLRFRAYCQNRESLTSMAYICLTVLEASASSRKNASKQYCVDYAILDVLGKLCSTKGDVAEARKAPKGGQFIPLSQKEREWIVSAIKMLIRRAGEYAYDPGASLKQLTMKDLPDPAT